MYYLNSSQKYEKKALRAKASKQSDAKKNVDNYEVDYSAILFGFDAGNGIDLFPGVKADVGFQRPEVR
jgi:hypothetical protein